MPRLNSCPLILNGRIYANCITLSIFIECQDQDLTANDVIAIHSPGDLPNGRNYGFGTTA